MAVILRYFSELVYLPGVMRKSARSLSHLLMSSCLLRKLSRDFKLRGMSILHEFQKKISPCCLLGRLVFLRVAHVDMTLNRSKVKVKVTGLPNFRKLRFSKCISSASLPRSSKLMVDYGDMGPNLQLVGAQFLNFLPSKLSHDFKLPTARNVDII